MTFSSSFQPFFSQLRSIRFDSFGSDLSSLLSAEAKANKELRARKRKCLEKQLRNSPIKHKKYLLFLQETYVAVTEKVLFYLMSSIEHPSSLPSFSSPPSANRSRNSKSNKRTTTRDALGSRRNWYSGPRDDFKTPPTRAQAGGVFLQKASHPPFFVLRCASFLLPGGKFLYFSPGPRSILHRSWAMHKKWETRARRIEMMERNT